MKNATLRNKIQEQYVTDGYKVTTALDITISGQVAKLKDRIDLVKISEDKNSIIEI